MTSRTQLANEAWEALFRAQVVLMRSFVADDVWAEVSPTEYDVLYTLAKAPGGLTGAEVNRDILMTQGGVSKLVSRLVERGFVERCTDPADRRTSRLVLTARGADLQRSVGRRHAQAVAAAMTNALDPDQLEQLRTLGRQVVTLTEARDALRGRPCPVASADEHDEHDEQDPQHPTRTTSERASA